MSLLIPSAFAQGGLTRNAESNFLSFIPLLLMFIGLYFIIIRPQMKRQKEHRNMLETLSKGDEIATSGGLVGKVVKVADNYLFLEIANNVQITIQKSAVTLILPKGTIKLL